MYCPRCATQNDFNAKFCRSCGADISLLPDALSGQLARKLAAAEGGGEQQRGNRDSRPSMERVLRSFFMGIAFLFVAFGAHLFAPDGQFWWYWMFIPAFAFFGKAAATYHQLREERQGLAPRAYNVPKDAVPASSAAELPPRNTSEIIPPPSITEETTRRIGIPVERQPRDS